MYSQNHFKGFMHDFFVVREIDTCAKLKLASIEMCLKQGICVRAKKKLS